MGRKCKVTAKCKCNTVRTVAKNTIRIQKNILFNKKFFDMPQIMYKDLFDPPPPQHEKGLGQHPR